MLESITISPRIPRTAGGDRNTAQLCWRVLRSHPAVRGIRQVGIRPQVARAGLCPAQHQLLQTRHRWQKMDTFSRCRELRGIASAILAEHARRTNWYIIRTRRTLFVVLMNPDNALGWMKKNG